MYPIFKIRKMGQLKCGEIQSQPNIFNMQCNQPYWYTGFQNNAQYQYPFPYQIQSPYPEVIGEGDVISMTLPDGRVQSYFVPANRRDHWIPCNVNPTNNSVPVWTNGNNTAWFVRNIINPYPTADSFSSVPYHSGNSHATAYANVNSENQGYIQKFHNDSCTSTTELHYFYPQLRSAWISNNCAGVQVEIPKREKTILHYETICSRPCYCSAQNDNKAEQPSETPMLIDEIKSTICCCKREKNRSDNNLRKKNKNVCCICHSQSMVNTSDKAVTTYADQAISCTGKKGCKSQTDKETGMWFKKKSKNIERSSRSLDTCDSSCCLDSACCCNSDQTINK